MKTFARFALTLTVSSVALGAAAVAPRQAHAQRLDPIDRRIEADLIREEIEDARRARLYRMRRDHALLRAEYGYCCELHDVEARRRERRLRQQIEIAGVLGRIVEQGLRRRDDVGRGAGSYGRRSGSFRRGPETPFGAGAFRRRPEPLGGGSGPLGRGPETLGSGSGSLGQGLEGFGRGQETFGRGRRSHGRGPGSFRPNPAPDGIGAGSSARGPEGSGGLTGILGNGSGSHGRDRFRVNGEGSRGGRNLLGGERGGPIVDRLLDRFGSRQ